MANVAQMLTSTLVKKYVMAVTGIALTLFVVVHLLGNLQLLLPSGEPFNTYAHKLETLGPLLYAAEIGLIITVLLHVAFGIIVTGVSRRARPVGYAYEATKGGASGNNISSRNMLILGAVILVFIIIHVWHFKFGPGIEQGYVAQAHGTEVRDLHRLVVEEFQKPLWVLFYVGVMVFLGFHLRHGIWSSLQSLGAMPTRYSGLIYLLGMVAAILLAVGFMLLPIWIYLDPLGVY